MIAPLPEPLLLDDYSMVLLEDLLESDEDLQTDEALIKLITLSSHICLLYQNRDLEPVRQLDWHIKVSEETLFHAYWLQVDFKIKIANMLWRYRREDYFSTKKPLVNNGEDRETP